MTDQSIFPVDRRVFATVPFKNISMKKAFPKNVRRVHAEHLSNTFVTTVLFLLLLSITAFALAGCYTDLKNPGSETAKMQRSTAHRFTGYGISH